MPYDRELHHRRSTRWSRHDYSRGGTYFVTICAAGKQPLFGKIVDGQMVMNEAGRLVVACWRDLARRFHAIELDAFVVMPNHIHGIIRVGEVGALPFAALRSRAGFAAPLVPKVASDVGALLAAPRPGSDTFFAGGATSGGDAPGRQRAVEPERGAASSAPTSEPSLGQIIRAFKSVSARAVNSLLGRPEGALWQRNYFDRVIRGDVELGKIREYISTNPLRWGSDRENPEAMEDGPDRW